MLLWTSVLPLLGLAIFIISMATILPHHGGRPGPGVLVGWPNRIMILAHLRVADANCLVSDVGECGNGRKRR
jgi:hypothetical protein